MRYVVRNEDGYVFAQASDRPSAVRLRDLARRQWSGNHWTVRQADGDLDPLPAYPRDREGRLLDPETLECLTHPGDAGEYSVGTGDEGWSFDFHVFEDEGYVAIDSLIDSESGNFTEPGQYAVVPFDKAVDNALGITDYAWMWCNDNDLYQTDTPWEEEGIPGVESELWVIQSQASVEQLVKDIMQAVADARTRRNADG